MRFAQFAVRVWGCSMDFEHPQETAKEGIRRFRNFLKYIGMPSSLSEFGVKEEEIPAVVEHFLAGNENKQVGAFVKVGKKEAEEIYKMCF